MRVLKICSQCGRIKSLDKFHNAPQCKLGVRPECSSCFKKNAKEYRHSKEGLIKGIYGNQVGRTKKHKWDLPSYTMNELVCWCMSQEIFHKLYLDWKNNEYDRWKTPSIDRINDYESYTISNIQLMTWQKNFNKYQKDRVVGKNNKQNKKVGQFTKSGDFIAEFHSVRFAARSTGVLQVNLSACANNRVKSAGGYIWKFI